LPEGYWRFARCLHPEAVDKKEKIDPVSGYVTPAEYKFCSILRGSGYAGNCGPEGKWWTAKEYDEGAEHG